VFVTSASYITGLQRFGTDKVARFVSMRERYGEPDLTPLMKTYGQALM
jgi:uncharacterized protein